MLNLIRVAASDLLSCELAAPLLTLDALARSSSFVIATIACSCSASLPPRRIARMAPIDFQQSPKERKAGASLTELPSAAIAGRHESHMAVCQSTVRLSCMEALLKSK